MSTAQEQALTEMLEQGGVPFELLPHRHTETATAEARALGLEPDEVAKTVILRTPDGYARVVVPATDRVDLAKARKLLQSEQAIRLATESELAAVYPEFDLGAVPPVGGPAGDPVVVDIALMKSPRVVFEAGTHEESIRLRTDDLVRLAGARVGEVCET
jgi:Ala-tRNA(Pro) deacylase